MKPMHAVVTRVSRCFCCKSKYSRSSGKRDQSGKTAARQQAKRDLRREQE